MAYVTQVWGYRGLIGNLAQRELKSRYKRSVLGWLWSLINPASTLLIYTIVFGTIMRIRPRWRATASSSRSPCSCSAR